MTMFLFSLFKTQFTLLGSFSMMFTMAMRNIDLDFEGAELEAIPLEAVPQEIAPAEEAAPAEEDE